MPIYEYICDDCGWESGEVFEPIDEAPARCDVCDGALRRKIGQPGGRYRFADVSAVDQGCDEGKGNGDENQR